MNRLFALAVFALLAGGCARSDLGERAASQVVKSAVEGEVEKAKESAQKIGNTTVEGTSILSSDPSGAPLWELSARQIDTKGQGEGGLPRNASAANATFKLYRAGQLESTFAAPLIEFFNDGGKLRLAMTRGVRASNVGALGTDGVPIKINAPRGDVDVDNRVVVLSGGARVVRGDVTVTGRTLRTQTDLARSMMSGDVVAVSPQGKTRARDAVFAWKENRLAANVVTFTRPGLTLSGAKLLADSAAQKGTLSGDVRAQSRDQNGAISSARAPAVAFDWKADLLSAATATLLRQGATMEAKTLRTDSKLRVARAGDVTIRREGAILRAQNAHGFDGLSHLSGDKVSVTRDGTTLVAATAKADNWSQSGGTITGAGGVTATGENGKISAPNATWSGGANGQIRASGGVTLVAEGTTLRGQSGVSDAQFKSGKATLRGDVRAMLDDGSTLRAPQLSKSGERIVASGGAIGSFVTESELGQLTMRAPRVETTLSGQSATASGGVKLQSASGATASAPTATFNRATRKVVARGGVVYDDPRRGHTESDVLRADLRLQNAAFEGNVRGQAVGNLKDLFD